MAIKARLAAAGASTVLAAAGSLAYFYEGEIRQTYVDPVGVLTACVGSTNDVKLGQIYSEQECTELFLKDLRTAEAAVNRCTPLVPEATKPALISFTFNVGSGAYCSSTLAKLANAGDMIGACKQLYRWVYITKRVKDPKTGKEVKVPVVLPGLVTRRRMEAELCLAGYIFGDLERVLSEFEGKLEAYD